MKKPADVVHQARFWRDRIRMLERPILDHRSGVIRRVHADKEGHDGYARFSHPRARRDQLGHERTLVGSPAPVQRWLQLCREIAKTTNGDDGRPLLRDPYWYQRTLEPSVAAYVESLTLSRIIQLNTEIGDELPADVFHAPADAPY